MVSRGPVNSNFTQSITAGGTAQTVIGENPQRKLLFFQNTSDTDMRVAFGKTASATVGRLIPANSYGGFEYLDGFVPTDFVSVYCATTGKTFWAEEA